MILCYGAVNLFSLFTFQMASQFPKRDNHSAEHVWFCVCFISDLSLSQWITNTFWQHHRECSTMGHGSYGSWVKYSVGHMGHGSLEVTHRLPCFSLQSHNRTVIPTTYICIYIHFAITTSFMLALIDCVGSRSLSFRVYFGACTERQTWLFFRSLVLGRARYDNARWYWLPADQCLMCGLIHHNCNSFCVWCIFLWMLCSARKFQRRIVDVTWKDKSATRVSGRRHNWRR